MSGDLRASPNLITRFLRFFFYLIYEPFAWSYDIVAWLVSLGRWKNWIFGTLPELPGPRVLELGHGPGHLQIALNQKGIHVFGIDRSAQMGRIAYRRLVKARAAPNLVRATADHLPFPPKVFDQLVATFPSEYIVLSATLEEAKRGLSPRGKFVILPVAWIRGTLPWDLLAAWLFHVTGQAPSWNKRFSDPLRRAGFVVDEKMVRIKDSEVMLITARLD
jgi:ubiquinone/menaquinone biosynthesis C-methylase UbiE